MEAKLRKELEALPMPETTFTQLEGMTTAKTPARKHRRLIVAVALALALLLCGAGWAKCQYGMWVLSTSEKWEDLEKQTGKYDFQLPRELDGVPFLQFRIFGHVPQGASYAQAVMNPLYKPVSIDYGRQRTQEETYPDGMLRSETSWTDSQLSLDFGTTTNELWRYYFGIDENGIWTACEVPESYETLEYRGVTLQVGDTYFYDEVQGCNRYTRWVHWVDEERQLAFSICETDYTDPNRVVECAKYIIDLNQ